MGKVDGELFEDHRKDYSLHLMKTDFGGHEGENPAQEG